MALLDGIKTVFGSGGKEEVIQEGPAKTATANKTAAVRPKLPVLKIGAEGRWERPNGSEVIAHEYLFRQRFESRHTLLTGTTGAGKSQLIEQLTGQIQERGDKAIIVDHGGENLARFYREGDIILNPFDARFPGWSVFNEIREDFDYENLGRFVIPDGSGENSAWNGYAQSIFSATGRACARDREATMEKLRYYLLRAKPEDLLEKLRDEPAASLFEKGSEKMAANARSILGSYIPVWRYIQDGGFSIRDWVENDEDKRWIFVSYRESNYAALKGFISMVMSIAINYSLDLEPSASRRIWFMLDELATLEKLGSLSDGLAKLRKHGGCVLASLQAISQFRERYGKEGAETLMANFNTWISLRPGNHETAEVFSQHFGEQEVWREDYSDNKGNSGSGGFNQGEGVSKKLHLQRVVTPTELMMLDDMCAVVKFPGNMDVGFMAIPYTPRVVKAKPYIPRSA